MLPTVKNETEYMITGTNWTLKIVALLLSSILIFFVSSCEYQTLDDIFEREADNCHDGNISFMDDILPILQMSCNENICHGGNFPQARVFLTSYEGVAAVAEDGRLVGSLLHESGLVPMPLNEDMLDDCTLDKIITWVESGFPDN
ncbi:MAG: hypothetical protein EA362_13760 [Saprospirales bacterium]|nr:MAG: hypothetical protein EA362_13760 [Saprospirales bacterium]